MSDSERSRPGAATPGQSAGGGDPSMEDILASIRRILAEEEGTPPATPSMPAGVDAGADDGVFQLDASMMLSDAIGASAAPLAADLEAMPAPPVSPSVMQAAAPPALPPNANLVAPETAAAAATSVGSLVRTLTAERTTQVYSGGPTIEDMVRAELRPLLKQWLDANLPGMVERLVRVEIERVVGRAVP